jgi:acylphosphatase
LPDGGVEVLAYGSVAALDELAAWLKSGPPLAQVVTVEVAVPEQRDSNSVPEHFRTG